MAASYPRIRGTPRPDYEGRKAVSSPSEQPAGDAGATITSVPQVPDNHDHSLDEYTPDVIYIGLKRPVEAVPHQPLPPVFKPEK